MNAIVNNIIAILTSKFDFVTEETDQVAGKNLITIHLTDKLKRAIKQIDVYTPDLDTVSDPMIAPQALISPRTADGHPGTMPAMSSTCMMTLPRP